MPIRTSFKGFYVKDDFSIVDIIPTDENLKNEQICEMEFEDDFEEEENAYWN